MTTSRAVTTPGPPASTSASAAPVGDTETPAEGASDAPPPASSAASAAPAPGRRRDAERSRARLLEAAAKLFAERGYTGTGLRAVGEQAGVDAALVARYFGGKEGLYRAVLAADPLVEPSPTSIEQAARPPAGTAGQAASAGSAAAGGATGQVGPGGSGGSAEAEDPAELVRRAFLRWDTTGVTAMSQNVFRCDTDAATRDATAQGLRDTLLPRLRAMSGDTADPELRVELAAVVLLGVGVARSAGALPRLAGSESDDLVDLVELLVRTALGDEPR